MAVAGLPFHWQSRRVPFFLTVSPAFIVSPPVLDSGCCEPYQDMPHHSFDLHSLINSNVLDIFSCYILDSMS